MGATANDIVGMSRLRARIALPALSAWLVALAAAHPATAEPLVLGGPQQTFIFDGTVGASWDRNFTFTAYSPTVVVVTDCCLVGDQFEVFDNGLSLGLTSVPPPLSTGTFLVGPGPADITGMVTMSAIPGPGQGTIYAYSLYIDPSQSFFTQFDPAAQQNPMVFNGGVLAPTGGVLQTFTQPVEILATGGTVDTANADTSFEGDISGAGQLVKTGSGTLSLSGDNDYSGGTLVDAGTLVAASDFALPDGGAVYVNAGGHLLAADDVYATIGLLSDGAAGGGLVEIGTTSEFTMLSVGWDDQDSTFSGVISGPGSFEKTGIGTLTLTGVGSAIDGILLLCDCGGSGGLAIEGGSFAAGAGISVTESTLSVTDGGRLEQTDASGGFLVDAGTIIVDGENSTIAVQGITIATAAFGATEITVRNGGAFESASLVLLVDGTSVLVTGADSTLSALALGIGAGGAPDVVTVADGGLIDSPMGIAIAPDAALKIGDGAAAGTVLTAEIINDGEIIADFSGYSGIDAIISGTGTLDKSGTGELELTGISSYTGQTVVDGGLLTVNGDISSSSLLTVGVDGTVGGVGFLPATQLGGILAPGNSIGTLTVSDSLTFAPGSTYEVEVSTTAADRVDVVAGLAGTGTADLSGGIVVPVYEPGSYIARSYVILTAEGGLGGTEFEALAQTAPAGFTQELVYSNDDTVELVLDLVMRPEPEPEPEPSPEPEPEPSPEEAGPEPSPSPNPYANLNRNQNAVRDAIVSWFDANGGIPAEFAALSPEGLTQASAETAAAGIAMGQQAAEQFLSILAVPQFGDTGPAMPSSAPLAYARQGDTATSRVERAFGAGFGSLSAAGVSTPASYWQGWGAAYGAGSRIDGNTTIGSSDITSQVWGLAAGHDIAFGGTSLGAALGGGWGSYELANGFGQGSVGSFNAGVRATQELGPAAYLSGALAYGYHAFSTSRTVTGERYEADYSGHSIAGRAEAGWRFSAPMANLTPYGAVETVGLYTPSHGESASGTGLFALNYRAEQTISTRLELGARVSHTIDLDTGKLTLSGRAAWRHNLNPDRNVTAGFATLAGTGFVTDAAAASRNAALITLGVDYAMTGNVTLGLTADASIGDTSSAFAGKASIRIRW